MAGGLVAQTAGRWTAALQETLDRLREAFVQAEFSDERLGEAGLGPRSGQADDVWRLRAAAPDGPLSVLVRLWMVGAPVDRGDAAEAVAPATVDELEAAGLLAGFDDRRVRAPIVIKPYRDLLIASDRLLTEVSEPADYVPGVNPVARLLAEQTIRVPVRSALDLGTGNGTQMLAAARHADQVLGTDVNPRALEYARFNARLNGVENVNLAEGSWFEPVGDDKFDLILANIPFVVSPDAKSLYRDSGGGPGEVSESILRGAASRLAVGGFAHVMCEWGIAEGEDWSRAPSEWVRETGCDAVILRHDFSDPLAHSVAWNHRLVGIDPGGFEEAVERWTAHHRDHGFAALAAATIVLRRRAEATTAWISALEFGGGSPHDGSDHLLRLFRGGDFLQAMHGEPERILGERVALVDGVRLDQVLTRREERWRQRPAKLSMRPGLALTASVEPRALDLVFALDGRPVEEVIAAVAERRGADAVELRALALEALPELVSRGFVTVGG